MRRLCLVREVGTILEDRSSSVKYYVSFAVYQGTREDLSGPHVGA